MKDNEKSFFSIKMLIRLFHTIRYLKWQQIYYRVYYPLKHVFFFPQNANLTQIENATKIEQLDFPSFSIDNGLYLAEQNTFHFLNKTISFGAQINWDYNENGMLWSFHLHYFDWLNDKNIDPKDSLWTIEQYTKSISNKYVFNHSFPASLRIVNWIKFLIKNKIKDESIINCLYNQAFRLSQFPEYEIMGNHLLENGIALVWAGYYFYDINFIKLGEKIVHSELKEQILEDGAHFEKSTSYHTLILKNLLGLYSFDRKNSYKTELCNQLDFNCTRMLSFLNGLVDSNKIVPLFGDSNKNMTVCFNELNIVAQNLGINLCDKKLSESGFRKLVGLNFKLFFNNGKIKCNYQPGHIHADIFNFCLNINDIAFIVNKGISTYEKSELRLKERGTSAHNTISVSEQNNLDIWSGFRLGKRTKIKKFVDKDDFINFEHYGYYRKYKIKHQRIINKSDYEINIIDLLLGWKGQLAKIYFHFHPDILLIKKGNECFGINTHTNISIQGAIIKLEEYDYCIGFNKTQKAIRIVGIITDKKVTTTIKTNYGKTN